MFSQPTQLESTAILSDTPILFSFADSVVLLHVMERYINRNIYKNDVRSRNGSVH